MEKFLQTTVEYLSRATVYTCSLSLELKFFVELLLFCLLSYCFVVTLPSLSREILPVKVPPRYHSDTQIAAQCLCGTDAIFDIVDNTYRAHGKIFNDDFTLASNLLFKIL